MTSRKRSERLKPVRKLADKGQKDASRELGRSQQALSEQEARLRQLQDYREEYRKMFEGGGQRAIDPRRLRDERAFLARLDDVIRQQQKVVEENMAEYERQRGYWMEAKTRVNALDRVSERYRKREDLEGERREQRDMDDLSQGPKSDP